MTGNRGPGDVCLCDTAARKELRQLEKEGDPVSCIAFSPDGTVLAAGNGPGWLRIYHVSTGQEQRLLGSSYGGIVLPVLLPTLVLQIARQFALDLSRNYRVAQVKEYGESGGQ